MCVNDALSKINEIISDKDIGRVVVLIEASSSRFVSQFKNNNKLKFSVFQLITEINYLKFSSVPLFFIYTKEIDTINSVFIPSKSNPVESQEYLVRVTNNFFN
jgi:hypothetical protein